MHSELCVLFIGDIVGAAAVECVCLMLGQLQERFCADVIIANAENAWEGKGPSKREAELLLPPASMLSQRATMSGKIGSRDRSLPQIPACYAH